MAYRSAVETASSVVAGPRGSDLELLNRQATGVDELREELHQDLVGPAGRDQIHAAQLCEALADLDDQRERLREHAVACRFEGLARIHDSLARLRAAGTVAELLSLAAHELARCC